MEIQIFNRRYKQIQRIILLLLFVFPVFYYFQDINSNARQGINLWKSLFDGKLFYYYSINVISRQKGEMLDFANYGMFLNVLNGIWMLPLYVIEEAFGMGDIMISPMAKAWASLQPIFYVFISCKKLEGLADIVGIKSEIKSRLVFMYASGTVLVSSTAMRGQLDIIGLCFLICAVGKLILRDRKQFLIYGSLAILCKSFPVFIVLPLVMLTEKKVWKVLAECLALTSTSFLIELPFKIIDPIGVASKKPRIWLMFDRMTQNCISLMGHKVPIMFLALVVLFMGAYFMDEGVGEERKEKILYISFVGILPIILFMESYLQWLVYMYPFILLLIFWENKNLCRSIIIETISSLSLLAGFLMYDITTFGTDNKRGTIWEKLLQLDREGMSLETIRDYIMLEKHFGGYTLAYAVFFVWIFGAILIYYPRKNTFAKDETIYPNKMLYEIDIWLYLRAIAVFILINLSTFILLV